MVRLFSFRVCSCLFVVLCRFLSGLERSDTAALRGRIPHPPSLPHTHTPTHPHHRTPGKLAGLQSTASTCTRSAQRHRFRSVAAAVTPSAVGAMLLRRCPSHPSVSSDDVDADIAGMLADLSRLCAQIYGRWRIGAQLLEAIVQCPTANPNPTTANRPLKDGTDAAALGSPRPHLRRDLAHPAHHLRRHWAHPTHYRRRHWAPPS